MEFINHTIIGSGLSALISDYRNSKSILFTNNREGIKRSKRFYEYQFLGGNSNLWGGYINYKRYKKLLKNELFKGFMANNNFFKVTKFIKNKNFENTCYLSENITNKIFRVKSKNFKSRLIKEKINKISLKKNYILLESYKNTYGTNFLSLCSGNLGLIELLYNSNLLLKNDEISFYDGNVNYCLNIFLNHKNNYYIPMTLNEISRKLIYGKINESKANIKNTIIVQKFSNFSKEYAYSVEEILKYKSKSLRYFLSNHIVGVKVNKIPIKNYINSFSNRIKINCSGTIEEYIPGPISQDIIYNSLIN